MAPPAAKRRKVAAPGSAQGGIRVFGRVSKAGVGGEGGEGTRKRKRGLEWGEHDSVAVDGGGEKLENDGGVGVLVRSSSSRRGFPETPTKGARSRLIASSSPLRDGLSPLSKGGHATLPSSPESEGKCGLKTDDEGTALPDELRDLVNLHSSFLTALSLHYAHNGSMTPADLRNLAPGIERVWKKRRVTQTDVRRILALSQRDGGEEGERVDSLYLSDYGHGKICVEVAENPQKTQRRPINEETLHSRFATNLGQQWTIYRRRANPPNVSASTFISTLPLQPIPPCASLSKLAPLHSKGQLRLSDLKAGAITAQKRPLTATSANTPPPLKNPSLKETTLRSSSLLTRIRSKQLHQSTLPLPPSPSALARQSALQRLPDIAPVLASLALSSLKHCNDDAAAQTALPTSRHVSFTMPTLVQHLQMSLRNPIGKEEAGRCVHLLAEWWPEWVGVRTVGRMVGVTVKGGGVGGGRWRDGCRCCWKKGGGSEVVGLDRVG